MSTNTMKGFLTIAIIALIWNLLGVMAYVMQVNMSPDALSALPEAEQALYASTPQWAKIAFAVAVFGGAIGSLLLLFKKKLAIPVLGLSLIGILAQMTYNFFISGMFEVYGTGAMFMPLMIVLIGIFLVWYATKARNEGVLS